MNANFPMLLIGAVLALTLAATARANGLPVPMTALEMEEAGIAARDAGADAYERYCDAGPDRKECAAFTRQQVKILREAMHKAKRTGDLEAMQAAAAAFDGIEGRVDPVDDDD
jgi:hypothetical protein